MWENITRHYRQTLKQQIYTRNRWRHWYISKPKPCTMPPTNWHPDTAQPTIYLSFILFTDDRRSSLTNAAILRGRYTKLQPHHRTEIRTSQKLDHSQIIWQWATNTHGGATVTWQAARLLHFCSWIWSVSNCLMTYSAAVFFDRVTARRSHWRSGYGSAMW